jgi:UDP-N-acetyl-D-mannosaminuronic acid dehydrogenase
LIRLAIIGAGHVGAPFGAVAADVGIHTLLWDTNKATLAAYREGRMPFLEHGAEDVLRRTIGKTLFTAESASELAACTDIVLTIGTPLDEYQNPRLSVVIDCISDLLPYLRDGQHLMLRSTVFPGTTRRVDAFLRGAGRRIDVSFCPERIVQGHAITELRELPHIVSGCTPDAARRAKAIFQRISGQELYDACVEVTPEEAELTKLMLNSWRYIQFAVANEFLEIADEKGCNYDRIRHAMTWRYPRGESLPGPGFAAGPCLLKDTMQLAASVPGRFQLGQAARQVNEGLPEFIVGKLGNVNGKTVAILGMAFKGENDDTRDSLSFKLKRLLEFGGANVRCSDEYARADGWFTVGDAVAGADAVVIGAPHQRYRGLKVACELIDVWGVTRKAAA